MAFLRVQDYLESISETSLNQILEEARDISGDAQVREKSEEKSITRAKEYLTSRYITERIFRPYKQFNISSEYTFGDRIDWTADAWISHVYTAGGLVTYNGFVYKKNATTASYTAATLPTNATYFDNVGEEITYYISNPGNFDFDQLYTANDLVFYRHEIYKKNDFTTSYLAGIKPSDTHYFTRVKTTDYLTELTVTGVYPNNAAWTQGDNRNQSIVEAIVNMTINKLHSIINPRNIPQLRRDNFSAAIDWMKQAQKGDVEVDLPAHQEDPQEGFSMRFGSNTPTTHGY